MIRSLSGSLRAFKAHSKLGWDLEGNWAPAWLYVIFALIPPIFGVLMLVFMYLVIMGGGGDKDYLAFLLTGAAGFLFVRLLLAGAGMVVVEDREHYKTFRYIYTAPVSFAAQIFGRVAPKALIALIGAALTVFAGAYFLAVPVRSDGILWGRLWGSLAVGIVGMGALGWMLASLMLVIDRMGWLLAEGLAGLLYIITGAIFPLAILPDWIAALSRAIPITYWLDLWRISLYGDAVRRGVPELVVGELWSGLIVTALIWSVIASFWHRGTDWLARRWGKIEQETFY